ncbi:dienelactone hydrolase family protein [Caulobacter sp. 17J65-9]|uniref:dienelactone hydrolase family protein n=1 Tax=Caulobacter sp. 17J65-9 TaxID=2709382 RepID=UPI0013C8ED5F|nr:dienelactone hydrolase family protein [Caulobacter sp. 17J65-9]NEX91516.1 dienelactone hydrolase family protein [Caulobacter sp. 17J65-9]
MAADRMTLTTADGAFSAYVARPDGQGPWPAVVVIQEIFGVNAVMRGVCDRLASQGYLAVCPDLFWRIEPGIDITDHSEAEWKKAFALYNAFDVDKGVEDIAATIAQVRASLECDGKVGAVGYCLGGLLAFLTAARTDSDATVAYYGVGVENHLGEAEKLAHPLMMHIAEEDGFVPKDAQARIVGALKNHRCVTIFSYPGRDHAFTRTGGQNFHAEDAAVANGRTGEFFAKHLK